ncbi:MAG: hypothetical protein K6U02_01660 [Firmicutes bacterium]|nr:hypothetical protein [Bacillota bacterium]
MRPAIRTLFWLSGWLGIAYLSYWTALLLDRVVVDWPVYALTGANEVSWHLTPYTLSLRAAAAARGSSPFSLAGFGELLQLGLQAGWIVLAARSRRLSWRRGWLAYTALWTAFFLGGQAYRMAMADRGTLAWLVRGFTSGASANEYVRGALGLVLGAALLYAAMRCTRNLLATLAASLPSAGLRWRWASAALLFLLATHLLAWGSVGFSNTALRGFGLTPFLLPVVTAPVLVLLAWQNRKTCWAQPDQQPIPLRPAGLVLGLAVSLYAGLAQADTLRVWWAERAFARVQTAGYEILHDARHYPTEEIERFAARRHALVKALASRAGAADADVHIRLVFYPDSVSKRLATRDDRHFTVQNTTIRAFPHPQATSLADLEILDGAAEAEAVLNHLWGDSGAPLLRRWAARWLAGSWRGRAVDAYAAQIVAEEGHYTLAELLDPASDGDLSPLVREPLGAAWIASVAAVQGMEAVRALYRTPNRERTIAAVARRLTASPEELEAAWQKHTAALLASHPMSPPAPRPRDASIFLRGMTLSHEGWGSGRGGYDSPEAEQQLQELRAMGVNAIAVVPYGWMRTLDDVRIHYTGTDETDEELAQLVRVAHRLGLRVMLKPQLWVGGGAFTGHIRFDDPERRAAWLASYRRMALHYARVAELEGFDLFCIGNELGGMTRHETEWREIIAAVRRVFRGPVTYAANWGEEFETLRFWDALDFIGLNNYYPLAEEPGAELRALTARADAVAEKIARLQQRWQRPILFTEVGYPSVRGGTVWTWARSWTQSVSMEEQAAGYEATLRAFTARPWLSGMFWWNWPSHGRGGGPQDLSYTPRGKPAAEVLRTWYTRLAATAPGEEPAPRTPSTGGMGSP